MSSTDERVPAMEDETLRERLRVLLFARVLMVTVFLAAVERLSSDRARTPRA